MAKTCGDNYRVPGLHAASFRSRCCVANRLLPKHTHTDVATVDCYRNTNCILLLMNPILGHHMFPRNKHAHILGSWMKFMYQIKCIFLFRSDARNLVVFNEKIRPDNNYNNKAANEWTNLDPVSLHFLLSDWYLAWTWSRGLVCKFCCLPLCILFAVVHVPLWGSTSIKLIVD